MWIRVLAAGLLVLLLWRLFRFAMGLRWSKVSRETSRREEESRGRRVIAEIPLPDDLVLFLEDHARFYWGRNEAGKREVAGTRLLLNGAVMAQAARPGLALPEPSPPEDYVGGERWDVALFLEDGRRVVVPCGALREGVSREIAMRVFEAVRRAVEEVAR